MKNQLNTIEHECNVLIKNISTLRSTGFVKEIYYPKTQKQLICVYDYLKENDIPFKIIGNGSNILFSHKSEKIAIISTKKLKKYIKINGNFVICSSGTLAINAFSKTYKHNLSGFEFFAGIPATIGGLIYMNGGAFGKSIFEYIEYLKVYKNKKVLILNKNDIQYTYRHTNLQNLLILSAKFKLNSKNCDDIHKDFVNFSLIRRQKIPNKFSIGSIFKNPPGYSAGYLIEQCGLKGFCIGDAEISKQHANIIINNGNASFEDVYSLIKLCKEKVQEKFNVNLELEIQII